MNIFVLNNDEVNAIVEGRHSNPHHILGMHKCLDDVYVNAFVPGAAQVYVVCASKKKEYAMEKVRDGFYSVKIQGVEPFDYELKKVYKAYEKGEEVDIVVNSKDPYSYDVSADLKLVMDVVNGLDTAENGFKVKNLFGARYITMNETEGVAFCMNMPGALSVSVVGDFNNWDARVNPMRKIDYTDIYEIFIPEKLMDVRYKFEALYSDGHKDIFSDPYATAYEVVPGNASLLTELSYEYKDSEFVSKRKEMMAGPINMYELHMPTWMEGANASYKVCADKLIPYIKDMGYNFVSLMPLMEYGSDENWGYDTIGMFAPSSRFGTPVDFMAMVDAFHENGIGVVMDMVPVKDIDAIAYWIDTYHLDGVRLDDENLISSFKNITGNKYDDIMIGCAWNNACVNSIIDFMQVSPMQRSAFAEVVADSIDGEKILAVNHDLVSSSVGSVIDRMPGGYEDKYANLRMAYGLYMTLPGSKLMFMGQELGLFGGFNGKTPIDWTMLEFDANKYIQKFVKDINNIYMTENALSAYDAKKSSVVFSAVKDDKLAIFSRGDSKSGEVCYIVCNFGIKDVKNVSLKVFEDGEYTEIISSDNAKYGGEGAHNKGTLSAVKKTLKINVPALSFAIIKKK